MFNIFKKKKKSTRPQNKYAIQRDQEIAYEIAKEYINEVDGILFRYKSNLSDMGKDQTEEEKAHIAWIEERQKELWQEKRDLKLDNLEINNKIIGVYATLMKEYFAMPEKDEAIVEKGLPEKFVTTKVDLSEFYKDKGA